MSQGKILQVTRRYGPLRGPTSRSCGGLRPSAEAFYAVLAHFWCPVVTMVTFSSNISNNNKTKKNPKNSKNYKKFPKNSKIQKTSKKSKKNKKQIQKKTQKI